MDEHILDVALIFDVYILFMCLYVYNMWKISVLHGRWQEEGEKMDQMFNSRLSADCSCTFHAQTFSLTPVKKIFPEIN